MNWWLHCLAQKPSRFVVRGISNTNKNTNTKMLLLHPQEPSGCFWKGGSLCWLDWRHYLLKLFLQCLPIKITWFRAFLNSLRNCIDIVWKYILETFIPMSYLTIGIIIKSTHVIFLKRRGFKDIKYDILVSQLCHMMTIILSYDDHHVVIWWLSCYHMMITVYRQINMR